MNIKLNAKYLPLLAAGMGTLALLGRMALFLLGEDEKGLLIPGHPLDILVWAITAAAALLVIIRVWMLDGSQKYAHNFGPSVPASIGCFVMAAGIALAVLSGWNTVSRLELIRNVVGLLAVAALIAVGLHRRQGKRPFFLLHGLVCLYLTLYAVSHYQIWSSRPQLQNWLFSTAAGLLLSLFAYYQTAFDEDLGKRRMQLGTGLLAGFFCLAAMAGGEDILLYLGGAAWSLTNLCSLTPVPRRRKNPITETNREEQE